MLTRDKNLVLSWFNCSRCANIHSDNYSISIVPHGPIPNTLPVFNSPLWATPSEFRKTTGKTGYHHMLKKV